MHEPRADGHLLDRLYAVVISRKDADPDRSYTAALFRDGPAGIARKVGEEAVETLIEAMADNPEQLAEESADLLFHLLVLWASRGVEPVEVWRALEARQGVSGLVEKASRGEDKT